MKTRRKRGINYDMIISLTLNVDARSIYSFSILAIRKLAFTGTIRANGMRTYFGNASSKVMMDRSSTLNHGTR